jgi:Family of unknown function (DUF6282)
MRPDQKLLVDAIDMHAHTHPALFNRPIDDADLAKHAMDYGMRGFVLKDHDSMTTGRAYHVGRRYPEVTPFGAVVLNRSAGGLNPHVVQTALHYGARVIWMPSNHSRHHGEYFDTPDYPQLARKRRQLEAGGVTVFDNLGNLKPEVGVICDLVAEEDACLATGHLSLEETRALQAEATKRGVTKFLVTHVNWALTKYDLETQKELIANGAYLEYVAVSCVSPIFWEQKPDELAEWIEELSGERLILSSDLGQASAPPHPEGMRMLISSMLDVGADYDQLELMTKRNPAHLLGLTT